MSPQCLPPSFGSIWLATWDQMRFEAFQDGHLGSHLRYWNRTILVILNLYVAQMPPIKFGLNQHYDLGRDVVWRISKWPPRRPSLISVWNKFSSWLSMSPHCLPLSFSLMWLTVWVEFQDFQDGHHGCHHGYWNGTNLAILNLHVIQMPPTKFGEMWFEDFQDGHHGDQPEYLNGMILAILNLHVAQMPPTKFRLNLTAWAARQPSWLAKLEDFSNSEPLYVALMLPIKFRLNPTNGLGGDVLWGISRWPRDIGTELF